MIKSDDVDWPGTKAAIEALIEAERTTLERQREPIFAAEGRGKIAALRAFIALVEDVPDPIEESPGYN